MTRRRYGNKRDACHAEALALLDAIPGVEATDAADFGDDWPDLVVGVGCGWLLIELKSDRGELRDGQARLLSRARGPWAVAHSAAAAVDLVLTFRQRLLSLGVSPALTMRGHADGRSLGAWG